MSNLIKIEVLNFRCSLLKKKIDGFYSDERKKHYFLFEEKGFFIKRSHLIVEEIVTAKRVGSIGEIMINGSFYEFKLKSSFFKPLRIIIPSNGAEKTIDRVKISKPNPDGYSDMVFFNGKIPIFHCLLKKTKLSEAFTKINLQKVNSCELLNSGFFAIMLFYWCLSCSSTTDGFSGISDSSI